MFHSKITVRRFRGVGLAISGSPDRGAISAARSGLVDSCSMSSSMRPRPLAALLMMFFFVFLLTGTATGQDDKTDGAWDQAAATKLATELEQTLQKSYESSLKAPPQQTALQQRERDAAQGGIRRARDLGEEYARKMRAGWDRGASEPYFRVVAEEMENVWTTAGRAEPAESARPRIDRLRRILDELRALYDAPRDAMTE